VSDYALNQIDPDIAAADEVLGKECNSCYRLLSYKHFRRDSSMKDGYKSQCTSCEAEPKLSMAEHTSRLKERNFGSEAVKKQRHEDQEEFRKVDARWGRVLHTSDLLLKLHRIVPNLFIKEGGIAGDLAMYLVAHGPRKDWDGKNYKYLGYVAYGELPEYSLYQFDDKNDVMIREDIRGWRTVLLRFIKADLLTEEQCDKEFGKPSSRGSTVWYKQLYNHRNRNVVAA
jgi:hypothetical protein